MHPLQAELVGVRGRNVSDVCSTLEQFSIVRNVDEKVLTLALDADTRVYENDGVFVFVREWDACRLGQQVSASCRPLQTCKGKNQKQKLAHDDAVQKRSCAHAS